MSWQPYAVSLGAGLAVGVAYGLISVRSPAPPIIALLGLLGMLAGESIVQWVRGHQNAVAHALHEKSFAVLREDLLDGLTSPPSTKQAAAPEPPDSAERTGPAKREVGQPSARRPPANQTDKEEHR